MASYPLIIFGAGASFDSLSNHGVFPDSRQQELKKWCPPLTNNIFDRTRFEDVLNKYPDARYIDGEIKFRMERDPNLSLEGALTNILEKKAPKDHSWYSYLMSFRLYIRELFAIITDSYFDKTGNYFRLKSEIDECCGGRALVVNFNYDHLFERNLFDVTSMSNVDQYMEGPIKILKIHGAYNWLRPIGNPSGSGERGTNFLIKNAKEIFEFENSRQRDLPIPRPTIRNSVIEQDFRSLPLPGEPSSAMKYFVPDISLPIHVKRDYVCPDDHMERFKRLLSNVDRIIIIGWKAADKYLLDLLKDYIGNKPVIVISPTDSEEIAKRLHTDYRFRTVPLGQTFSNFLSGGNCERVLAAENMDVLVQGSTLNGKGTTWLA